MRPLTASTLTSILSLASAATALAAEEGKVQAMAVLQGDGTMVHVGEKESMLVAVLEGVMFIASNKGRCTWPRWRARFARWSAPT